MNDMTWWKSLGALVALVCVGAGGVTGCTNGTGDSAQGASETTRKAASAIGGVSCSAVAVSPSAASPQPSGTTITWTASSTCTAGSAPRYRFWLFSSDTGWSLAQAYSASPTFTWTPATNSHYRVEVDVVDAQSAVDYEAYSTADYTIQSATACTTVTASPSAPSPQMSGTPVTFTATSDCGASAQYRFWTRLAGGPYSLAQDYSTNAGFAWNTNVAAGDYQIEVDVRAAGNVSDYQAYQTKDYTLVGVAGTCATVTGSASPASPQPAGTTVAVTGSATCAPVGAQALYRFWVCPAVGSCTMTQNYSTNATFNWNTTGLTPGNYRVEVDSKSSSSADDYEGYDLVYYTVGAGGPPPPPAATCSSVTDVAAPASPQPAGTTVTFTASATCGAGVTPEYRFWVCLSGSGCSVAQAYSTNAVFTWNTAVPAGNHYVEIDVRAVNSANDYEGYTLEPYTVQ